MGNIHEGKKGNKFFFSEDSYRFDGTSDSMTFFINKECRLKRIENSTNLVIQNVDNWVGGVESVNLDFLTVDESLKLCFFNLKTNIDEETKKKTMEVKYAFETGIDRNIIDNCIKNIIDEHSEKPLPDELKFSFDIKPCNKEEAIEDLQKWNEFLTIDENDRLASTFEPDIKGPTPVHYIDVDEDEIPF